MQQPDFDIDELCCAIEAKDNSKKVRIELDNLRLVNENLNNLLGDNLDFSLNTLKFAYKILLKHFKDWLDNWYDNEQLSQIENIYINFTKMQSELHTSGIKNKDLKAYAYYGLHAINFIRGEYRNSLIIMFKVFIINTRMARYLLFFYAYKFDFYPLISDVLKKELKKMSKYPNHEDYNDSIEIMREFSDLRRYRLEEIEQKIDYECAYIAEYALKGFGCIGDIL
jgi:hypothetical protein